MPLPKGSSIIHSALTFSRYDHTSAAVSSHLNGVVTCRGHGTSVYNGTIIDAASVVDE